jgi:hypothetical protein
MFPLSGRLYQYQESQIQIPFGPGHLCGIPRNILEKGLSVGDNPLYSWRFLFHEMISRASFGIVLCIGAVLFAIWPNILPLQQYLAMVIPYATPAEGAPANTTAGAPANTTAGAPANTTAGAPANTTAGAPEAGDPAGEEVLPHWYGGAPCPDNSCHD